FTVAGRGRPVWLFADRDAARRLVRRRVEYEQLARPLHNDYAECRAARVTNEMRRNACRNLPDDLVGGRIEHLYRADPGLSKVKHLAVVTELPVARRLLERQGANDTARSHIDKGEPEMARFLNGNICELAVGADRYRMRVGNRHRGNHGLCRGINEGD